MNRRKSENYCRVRLRNILNGPKPDYPASIPFYRGKTIRENADFGIKKTIAWLFRSRVRIDAYMVVIEEEDRFELFSMSVGMAEIDAEMRRRNPPVMSPNNC